MDEHRVYLHAGWDVFFHLSEHIVGPYFFGDVSLHWNDLAWIVGRADIGKMAYRRQILTLKERTEWIISLHFYESEDKYPSFLSTYSL